MINNNHMKKLFINKSIEINAPASKVWDVLTKPQFVDQWAAEFSSSGPKISVESDWKLGSPVLWKDESGKIAVEGKVLMLEPNKKLHYSVIDVEMGEVPTMDETDGITYLLAGHAGSTKFSVVHGDFGKFGEGQKYYDMTAPVWDRILPKVKKLAE
jgi:uncharacterized protein YndB with AHSA1/START domain